MGLSKVLNNYQGMGFDIGYWKISDISFSIENKNVSVSLCGYSNQANKNAGEVSRASASLNFDQDNYPFTLAEMNKANNNPIKIIYNLIKLGGDTLKVRVRRFGEFDLSDAISDE